MAGALFTFPGRRRYAAISPRVRMSLARQRLALASTKQPPADAAIASSLAASFGGGERRSDRTAAQWPRHAS